jgi:GTP-binding protein
MGALKRAQVGVLVLEATEPISAQDKRIGGYIQEAQIASLIVVNKWDLLTPGRRRDPNTKRKFAESLAHELDFLAYSPVIYVSAKTGEETEDILGAALDVLEQWDRRVETGTLNQVIQEAVALRPPPSYKGRQLKILYVSQKRTRPPTFIFKVNSPRLIHFSYRRYLENCLRSAYGFVGSPIVMKFVK